MTREQQKQIENAVRKKTAELRQQYPGLNFTQPRIQVIRPSTEISGESEKAMTRERLFDEAKKFLESEGWFDQSQEQIALTARAMEAGERLGRDEEREECAKVADQFHYQDAGEAIRARGVAQEEQSSDVRKSEV